MTHRMRKNIHLLKALQECSTAEQKQLLKVAKPELVHAICDCIVNVVHGRVPINNYQKGKLRKKLGAVKKLCNNKTPASKKKKILVQHGSGFLQAILGPVVRSIAGVLGGLS